MDFFNGFMRIVQMNDTNACYSDITCTQFFVMPLSVAKYIVSAYETNPARGYNLISLYMYLHGVYLLVYAAGYFRQYMQVNKCRFALSLF